MDKLSLPFPMFAQGITEAVRRMGKEIINARGMGCIHMIGSADKETSRPLSMERGAPNNFEIWLLLHAHYRSPGKEMNPVSVRS